MVLMKYIQATLDKSYRLRFTVSIRVTESWAIRSVTLQCSLRGR